MRQGLFCEGCRGAGICCDTMCVTPCSATRVTTTVQGEIIYPPSPPSPPSPTPPLPHFWPEGFFPGEGGGGVISNPPTTGILYPPLFYTPPTPRRVFSGVGGGGVSKFGPPTRVTLSLPSSQNSRSSESAPFIKKSAAWPRSPM